MLEKYESNPTAFNSHKTTKMTTTMLNILLIFSSIGKYSFTNHNRTPTTSNVSKIVITDIIFFLVKLF